MIPAFDRLPKDVLIETVVKFDIDDVHQFCNTYPQHRDTICNNDIFWRRKIKHDYGIDYTGIYPEYRYVYNDLRDWQILLEGVTSDDRNNLEIIDYAFSLGTLQPKDINLAVRTALENPVVLKHLIEKHGADVNSDNGTPLIGAAQDGNLESVKILVENGANIHNKTLATAVYHNHLPVVKYLVEQGADYNLPLYQNYIGRNDAPQYIRFMQGRSNPNEFIHARNKKEAARELEEQMEVMKQEERALEETTPLNKDIRKKIVYTNYKETLCKKLDRKSLYVLLNFAYLLGLELSGKESRQEICNRISQVL